MFRLSKETDKVSIKRLLKRCFGDFPIKMGALENLDGRYLIYRESESGDIFGMTGLKRSEELNGLEIDWTCVKPECRRQGIMHDLFKRICNLTDETIYCRCWRTAPDEACHMSSIMRDFGFKEVIHTCNTWCNNYNCKCYPTECEYYSGSGCSCWEDLYIRK